MAEVLGITASVIAVIQLTAKATSLSYDYINGVKHATDDLKKFKDELESLTGVLTTLQDCANENPESTALRKLDVPLRECIAEMEVLRARLEPKGWLRKNLARYKWPLKEKETSKYLLKIERLKSTFSLAIDADRLSRSRIIEAHTVLIGRHVEEINAGRQEDVVIHTDEKRMKVLNWIYPEECDTRHLEISGRRQSNTGNWLLKAPEVQDWAKENPTYQLLWGYGIPGAGKTFLSSLMIDDLRSRAAIRGYGVAYVYFNHKEQEQQMPVSVLSSLVKQLACQIRHLPEEIEDLYKKLQPRQERPGFENLYSILLGVIKLLPQPRAFIICDALDECNPDTQRTKLLPLFHQMGKDGISLFLTSREYPEDIQRSLQGSVKIRLLAKDEDIDSYIEQKIAENPRAEGLVRQGNCKEKIISELKRCANGMFLLVHFHIKYLCQQTTARQMLDELERLKSSSSLSGDSPMDPTYNRVMEIIRLQPKSCSQLAYDILSWLVKAKRVLSFRELQQAVSVEQDRLAFDDLALPSRETMLDVCASLVTIDEDSDTVRLTHYTVQEYLDKNTIIPEDANFRVLMSCVTFLSYDVFSEGLCTSRDSMNARIGMFPFLLYAAEYIRHHSTECDEALSVNLVLRLLMNPQNLLSFYQASMSFGTDWGSLEAYAKYTPLHAAASMGHLSVVQYLLQKGADISAQNDSWETALHSATRGGFCSVAQYLLEEGADISAQNVYGETALYIAVEEGVYSVVQLLLEKGADPSIAERGRRTPIYLAVVRENEPIVRCLVEKGADLSATDSDGRTPLHLAVAKENKPIVRYLIEKGADLSVTDRRRCTPLYIAVVRGNEPIVRCLVEKGADLSVVDYGGKSPLHLAVIYGNEPIVRYLVEKGADLSAAGSDGRTPLHLAVAKENKPIVRYLIEKGADLSATDSDGRTPLYIAVVRGNESIVRCLVEKGADLSVTRHYRRMRTLLHLAVVCGIESIVRYLLEKGAEPSAAGEDRETPLHSAVESGSKDMVKILLDGGADLSATDKDGHTPLQRAAALGLESMVQFLLESSADPSITAMDGSTPLQIAASIHGADSTIQILLEKGVELGRE